jgi:hypothetical protein
MDTKGAQDITLAGALEEFGATHQLHVDEFCIVAVRRPTPQSQEVTTGRTIVELLAKLRAEQDGRP